MSGLAVSAAEIAGAVGITIRGVRKRALSEGWDYKNENGRGGDHRLYYIEKLPGAVQTKLMENMDAIADTISHDILPALSPGAAMVAQARLAGFEREALAPVLRSSWEDGARISESVLTDPRVRRIARIVQEALDVPAGVKKTKWMKAVAMRHDVTKATIYKWITRYRQQGLVGLAHTKCNRGAPKKWSPEALDFFTGLCLKHHKIAKDALYYEHLVPDAEKNGWQIGTYRSAMDWYGKRSSHLMERYSKGGVRALDNALPPVLRSYADLDPFEILVGDQHRFDFWVMDDQTGEVFRPEGFFWQDLRTRCFYGGAVDRKYDSQLIGLALRIGIRRFGAFGSIYTDHGKPEMSKYIMGVLAAMRTMGLSAERTIDGDIETAEDQELVNPCVLLPGTHKKAIVRNAKAKMIEGTFRVFEGILRDHVLVPGYVKRLNDSQEEQDKAHRSAMKLARAGKLLTPTEFALKMYQGMDYYNIEKFHRGVVREWAWLPKPKTATPTDCLKACVAAGWRPRWLRPEEVDLVFLAHADRDGRVVDHGRISFRHGPHYTYEHDALIDLPPKTRVEVRYDPLDPEWVLCFSGGEFLCCATPVEYSSMIDQDLASRKIEEKRARRKAIITECRRLMCAVPDILKYSEIPADDKAQAVIGTPSQRRKLLESRAPVKTAEELARDIRAIENYRCETRPIFSSESERFRWLIDQGDGCVSEEDAVFMRAYESRMSPESVDYWNIYRSAACGGGH